MDQRRSKSALGLTIIAALLYGGYQLLGSDIDNGQMPERTERTVVVASIVDGDTIRVRKPGTSETTRVRLLNIDTPELNKECYADEAKQFVEGLIPEGTQVQLVYDQEQADHYGRELAGVYAGETFVNREVAAAGFAVPILVQPNTLFYEEIERAAAEAKESRRGVFAADSGCEFAGYKTQN